MNYLNNLIGTAVTGDSSLQLNNVEILYTKVQRVYMKPQHNEERQRELRVNVEIHAGISPVCRKSLCVLLADDDDPCFLYSLFITEDDFKILKSQQGLLVDFDNFATQLIYLLEQCQIPSTNVSKTPPKFLLLLAEESGEWIFKLVETNNFKHLCHLSLNISPASDSDLKTHMAMKIKQLKENILQQNRDALTLETRLNDLSNKVETKTKELEQLEQKYMSEKNQIQISSSEQISLEKDRFAKAQLEWQYQSEKEKLEVERKHTEIIKQLHTELAELRTQNVTYKDKLSLLEATNIEQFKQLQTLEKELNVAQRDLNLLKKQNSKLDTDYHEKDKSVNSLKTKVAVLEQELKDKSILINKHTEMLKTAKEQKQYLEDLLTEKEGQLQRKQNSLRNLSDELVKANEILTKLQNELASTKSKLKLRTSIALEQERLLDTKQKEVGQLESKMENLIKETEDAKTEVENLKEQVKTQQAQLEEKEKIIKNNDNVISWLNRRLADSQSPLQNITAAAPITVPSSIQLTLPRTNKLISNKYETRTPTSNTVQMQTNTLSGVPLRNPIVQNPNINQTSRITARSMGVGITDNTIGISTFNKSGQISSTSTPMERINSLNKISGTAAASSMPVIIENNNSSVPSNGTKTKSTSITQQGGLRRAGLSDKPILPSAYFPKTLH
ncbi:spindle assembly abnormal protein 6 [Apis mellifera caucasica]|uniref:Spindle assembly abnormal protein 6 homolog n=1 Tax=Apis mellifera TaxID=7460 RepID=A0A7M7R8L3_APIME|nr:spindle assembly abnormal protein 6 homolog [Apis mellifera]KAG6798544.1 spindle assembly abnormal protein 6 [Apis mellifera caucasica]KAG9434838.1 spindle assembly abnormal protein 6 [Apis mellifera carnica]|eukprot:XP_395972.4 spindle assembly abnormal protein 6 homolog [Apis mellifera]